MKFLKNDRGTTVIELAMVATPVLLFIFGIMQTGYIVWTDNLLNISVDAAARCGAVNSTTAPCFGSGLANMQSTANLIFGTTAAPFNNFAPPTFGSNSSCSSDGGTGLIGTYSVTIVMVVNLTLTAKSCYPTVPVPS